MGAGGSKPSSDGSHVFSAENPVRFSQQVLDQLQSSAETDSTRARATELHIQQRVHAELTKIKETEGSRLSSLLESLTPSSASPEDSQQADVASRSHDSVKKEIAELKAKLGARRKLEAPGASVGQAKDELVACLRANDRRPLDCWREVEAFKDEVARVERGFVERTMR